MPVRLPLAVLVLALGTTCGLVAVSVSSGPGHRRSVPASAPSWGSASTPVDRPGALAVLHAWDRRRAAAWAAGDESALAALYTAGAPAGQADRALLRRYTSRGLLVREMRMQVLRARVLALRPRLLELEVTDRLAGGTVIRSGAPAAARRLPVDAATTHVLTLRRIGGAWLMARVSTDTVSAAVAGR